MTIPSISIHDARMINLAAQGLLSPPTVPAEKADVLNAIRRMGLLQIDTIHVVARSPYFVLFSRLGKYDPAWLDELLVEKQIFEQWAHAACYLPIEDFPLIRRLILEGMRDSYFSGWIEENIQAVQMVHEAISRNGPMKSADFESEKGRGGWWNWKLEKGAMEYLFSQGELTVIRRENFQRVYDLTSRALADWDDGVVPPLEEVYRDLVLKSVRAMGVARLEWVADYYRLPKRVIASLIPELVSKGSLREATVEGWKEPLLYAPETEELIEAAFSDELQASYTTLLSPFDPVVWDRARARKLFNFDFMIQAYTPAAKRKYGYFPLPILHNGALVGRLDSKAHRKEGIFEIKGFFLEKSIKTDRQMVEDLAAAIQRCADWHATPLVSTVRIVPEEHKNLFAEFFQVAPVKPD